MKHINEFNVFKDIPDEPRESEILSDMSSLFCDKIDKFVRYDPDWKRLSSDEKKEFIEEAYDAFINKYYAPEDLVTTYYEEDYLDELIHLLKNNKNKIISAIIKEIEERFYPNMPT